MSAWLKTRKGLEREIEHLRRRLEIESNRDFYNQRDLDFFENEVRNLGAENTDLREKVSVLRDLLWSAEQELADVKARFNR